MFKVRQYEARTLSWWADQRRLIDFDPPYQRRGGLWSRRDKQFLIDSILNDYDIPKIYLADFTLGPSPLNPQNRQFAVIDGKQRFEAILDFFDGRITLSQDFVLVSEPALALGRLGYRDLKAEYPSVASRFENFNLTVMTIITDEEGKINELFVRLNRNKTLTGPEIRNAMQGPVPELVRDIATDDFFTQRVAFATNRGQALDIAAKFLLVEFRGGVVETKRANLDRLVEEGLRAEAAEDDFRRAAGRVSRVLHTLDEIFLERDPLLSTQGALVPYYLLVRGIDANAIRAIRPFLVSFESARQINRRAAKDPNADVDPEFARYDQLSRSINDARSIEGRLEVLEARLSEYTVTRKVLLRPTLRQM
jgi:hypothetical protein